MPPSATDKILLDRIEGDFTYHPPNADQGERYVKMRSTAKQLAHVIVDLVPEGRERSLALTKLEEVVMWSNAGIARKQV